jgi:hypothetical protein
MNGPKVSVADAMDWVARGLNSGVIYGPEAEATLGYLRLAQSVANPGEDVVERVARLLDPSSWRVMDGYLAEVKRKYRGENAGYDPAAFKHKESMAMARAVIASLAGDQL